MGASIADGLGPIGTSPHLAHSLARAERLAREQGHPTVGIEHLLFALTEDPDATGVLVASQVDLERLRTDVSGHLARVTETMAQPASAPPRPDPELVRILTVAGSAARQSPRKQIDGAIILAAIIGDGKSSAAGLLKAHGLTFEDTIRVLQQSYLRHQAPQVAPPTPAGTRQIGVVPSVESAAASASVASVTARAPGASRGADAKPAAHTTSAPPVSAPPPRTSLQSDVPAPVAPGLAPSSPTAQPRSAAGAAPAPDPLLETVRARLHGDEPSGGGVRAPGAGGGPRLPAGVEGHMRPAAQPLASPSRPASEAGGNAAQLPTSPAPVGERDARAADTELPPRAPAAAPAARDLGGVSPPPASGAPTPPVAPIAVPAAARPVSPPLNRPPVPFPPSPTAGPPSGLVHQASVPAGSDPLAKFARAGGIAGPPFPPPDDVAPHPASVLPARVAAPGSPVGSIDLSRYLAGLSAHLTAGRAVIAELRLPRRDIVGPMPPGVGSGLQSVVTVRMRSMDGRCYVETDTPEATWISGHSPSHFDDVLVWRWRVTPRLTGRTRLQLQASLRSLAADGRVIDRTIPDCIVEARASRDMRAGLVRFGQLLLAGLAGFGLALLGGSVLSSMVSAVRRMVGL